MLSVAKLFQRVFALVFQISLFPEVIGLIDDISEIAQDESNTGVMAVMSIKDHF